MRGGARRESLGGLRPVSESAPWAMEQAFAGAMVPAGDSAGTTVAFAKMADLIGNTDTAMITVERIRHMRPDEIFQAIIEKVEDDMGLMAALFTILYGDSEQHNFQTVVVDPAPTQIGSARAPGRVSTARMVTREARATILGAGVIRDQLVAGDDAKIEIFLNLALANIAAGMTLADIRATETSQSKYLTDAVFSSPRVFQPPRTPGEVAMLRREWFNMFTKHAQSPIAAAQVLASLFSSERRRLGRLIVPPILVARMGTLYDTGLPYEETGTSALEQGGGRAALAVLRAQGIMVGRLPSYGPDANALVDAHYFTRGYTASFWEFPCPDDGGQYAPQTAEIAIPNLHDDTWSTISPISAVRRAVEFLPDGKFNADFVLDVVARCNGYASYAAANVAAATGVPDAAKHAQRNISTFWASLNLPPPQATGGFDYRSAARLLSPFIFYGKYDANKKPVPWAPGESTADCYYQITGSLRQFYQLIDEEPFIDAAIRDGVVVPADVNGDLRAVNVVEVFADLARANRRIHLLPTLVRPFEQFESFGVLATGQDNIGVQYLGNMHSVVTADRSLIAINDNAARHAVVVTDEAGFLVVAHAVTTSVGEGGGVGYLCEHPSFPRNRSVPVPGKVRGELYWRGQREGTTPLGTHSLVVSLGHSPASRRRFYARGAPRETASLLGGVTKAQYAQHWSQEMQEHTGPDALLDGAMLLEAFYGFARTHIEAGFSTTLAKMRPRCTFESEREFARLNTIIGRGQSRVIISVGGEGQTWEDAGTHVMGRVDQHPAREVCGKVPRDVGAYTDLVCAPPLLN